MAMSSATYDLIERAIVVGQRLVLDRRGTEYIVVPLRLRMRGRQEILEARHPTTGEMMSFALDELKSVEGVPR